MLTVHAFATKAKSFLPFFYNFVQNKLANQNKAVQSNKMPVQQAQ